MTNKQAEAMVLAIIRAADDDLWKFFNPSTSEDPELAETQLAQLVETAQAHMKKANDTIRVKVELRVFTTCEVEVRPVPDEDGAFDVVRITVPTIEGYTNEMDTGALSQEEYAAIDAAAAQALKDGANR